MLWARTGDLSPAHCFVCFVWRLGGLAQVYCLKALRAIESGHGIDPAYRSYVPDDPAVKALLTRDISSAMKDPYKAAVEDCLIITMKVHTCHHERLCMIPWHCIC